MLVIKLWKYLTPDYDGDFYHDVRWWCVNSLGQMAEMVDPGNIEPAANLFDDSMQFIGIGHFRRPRQRNGRQNFPEQGQLAYTFAQLSDPALVQTIRFGIISNQLFAPIILDRAAHNLPKFLYRGIERIYFIPPGEQPLNQCGC